jgi:hypothetical protein
MLLYLLNNVLLILSVIFLTTLCGLGILQLCGLKFLRERILLAPCMALAVSAILVALVVTFHIPVASVSPVIWLLWISFAVYGAMHIRKALTDLNRNDILWFSIFAILLLSAGYVWYGLFDYLGSPLYDGCLYVSFAEYLRVYPRGTEGGLAPLYQAASQLSNNRFVGSALLAALVPPWSSTVDTQMTVGPLLILSIFSYALSVAYATQIANQRGLDVPAWLVILFCVIGGWIPQALYLNNYDNLLALSFSPAIFAAASDRKLNHNRPSLLPAIFIGAGIYTYPELSALMIAAYGIVAIEYFSSNRPEHKDEKNKRAQLIKYAGIIAALVLIVSPYLQQAIGNIIGAMHTKGGTGLLPGQNEIPSLLDTTRVWGAMWGLNVLDTTRVWGAQWGLINSKTSSVVIGVLLGQFTLYGISTAIAKKYFSFVIYFALILVLLIALLTIKHYDYGAYKILLIGWWAIAIGLSAGIKSIWNAIPSENSPIQNYLRIVIITVAGGATSLWVAQHYAWIHGYKYPTAVAIREAREAVLKNKSAVHVSISDGTLSALMVYQLRNTKALFTNYAAYMTSSGTMSWIMSRSKVPGQNEIQYYLTDLKTLSVGDVVWKNKLLKLSKSEQPLDIVAHIPNELEFLGDVPFFWLGLEPASLTLTTPTAVKVHLYFENNNGPSLDNTAEENPRLFIYNSASQLFASPTQPGMHAIDIPLSAGTNTLTFRTPYNRKVMQNSNGDPRTLLVGIKLIKITVDEN